MTTLDGDTLERLRHAAEEIAYLVDRGYDGDRVHELVVARRSLSAEERALLARVACTEARYRARALKEMLPEDVARRPLVVDGHDLVDTLTTAFAGGALLEGLDQTLQPLVPGGAPAELDRALERLGAVWKEIRPSKTTWVFDARRSDAKDLAAKIPTYAKKWKVAVDVVVSDDAKAFLRKSVNVVTNDAALVDACKTWCNVTTPALLDVPGVVRIKLQ